MLTSDSSEIAAGGSVISDCFQKHFKKCVYTWLLIDSILKLQVHEFVATDSVLNSQMGECVAAGRQDFEVTIVGICSYSYFEGTGVRMCSY